ncbi:hypothetical protein ACFLUB_04460 [Chloroflexota bacterium]
MKDFKPRLMASSLPGMPHRDVEEACHIMTTNFPEATPVPFVTMSRKMFTERIPCLTIDREKRQLVFEVSGREDELVEFYDHYLANDVDYFAISEQLDPCLYRLAEMYGEKPWPELKYIHVDFPGLFTWGLLIKDENGNPALYNDTLRDIIIKSLAMKARWRERKVKKLFPNVETIVTAGDAALTVYSSAGGTGTWADVRKDYNEMLGLIEGIKCIHCCANFDWSLLMQTDTRVINFDAYQYGKTMSLYPDALKQFLERGGTIAWGIVPTFGSGDIDNETVDGLIERFESSLDAVVEKGIDKQQLLESSWITPACETGTMSLELAEKVYAYAGEISRLMRGKYFN